MGDAHSKTWPKLTMQSEIFLELERPAPSVRGKGMEGREEWLFQKSYFWIYRHMNVFFILPLQIIRNGRCFPSNTSFSVPISAVLELAGVLSCSINSDLI